jgi:hypothetical protein
MFKKLLQSAILIFLLMYAVVAIFLYDATAFGWSNFFLFVLMGFVFVYPIAAAIIVWNHNSSLKLKYSSALAGLIASLVYALTLGSMSQFIFLTYFFIIATSLSSASARFSMLLWRLLGFLQHHAIAHKY